MRDVPPKIAPWLAEVIRRERGGKGWSIMELADKAGVDRSYLGGIEAEKHSPKVETLEKLCDALGIRLSWLFVEAERRRDGGGAR
jgi:transcriptional regulator with XRE-family HTH domain